jgi:hypothetical protein
MKISCRSTFKSRENGRSKPSRMIFCKPIWRLSLMTTCHLSFYELLIFLSFQARPGSSLVQTHFSPCSMALGGGGGAPLCIAKQEVGPTYIA